MIILKIISYIFLWLVSLGVIIFFGTALFVFYNTYKNSPEFDPVVFDFSDRNSDGISEKNHDYMFYVPAKYWHGFQVGYKEAWKDNFFIFYFDFTNFDEANREKMKESVIISIEKSLHDLNSVDQYLNKLNSKTPDEVISDISIFKRNVSFPGDETTYLLFKGFDHRDVVVRTLPGESGMRFYRKLNSNIILNFKLNGKKLSEIYETDKKITLFIRNMQVPPQSFTRLK